jgi:hypothetical protein
MKKQSAKLKRQTALFVETISANSRELKILQTKSAETLRVVAMVKRVFKGARVREVKNDET